MLMLLQNHCLFRDFYSLRQFFTFLRQFFNYKRQKWVALFIILEFSLHFRNSRKHFIGAFHSVPQTTILGKRKFLCGFGGFSPLGQKLPFWDKSYRFRDINYRLQDKSPFKRRSFRQSYFRRFFIVGTKIAVLGRKLPFSGHKLPFWGKSAVFEIIFLLGQFSAIFSSFNGNFFKF